MTVPLTVLIGRSLKAAMSGGDVFRLTVYSKVPIFWVPTGVMRCWIERASCRIGTLEALKLRIVGGVTPVGICFRTVCDIAETSASAALMFTVGWKKILMIP